MVEVGTRTRSVLWRQRRSEIYRGPFRVVEVKLPTIYIVQDSVKSFAVCVADLKPQREVED